MNAHRKLTNERGYELFFTRHDHALLICAFILLSHLSRHVSESQNWFVLRK